MPVITDGVLFLLFIGVGTIVIAVIMTLVGKKNKTNIQ